MTNCVEMSSMQAWLSVIVDEYTVEARISLRPNGATLGNLLYRYYAEYIFVVCSDINREKVICNQFEFGR